MPHPTATIRPPSTLEINQSCPRGGKPCRADQRKCTAAAATASPSGALLASKKPPAGGEPAGSCGADGGRRRHGGTTTTAPADPGCTASSYSPLAPHVSPLDLAAANLHYLPGDLKRIGLVSALLLTVLIVLTIVLG